MELHGKEHQCLVERLSALATDGLVDVKFCLRNPTEATVEETSKEVNEMLQALEDGETELMEPSKPKARAALV